MPRFFFDTYDGDRHVLDEKGLDLPDFEAAELEAQRILPDMAHDTLLDGSHRSFVVNVRDEAGQIVLRTALSLVAEEDTLDDELPS
jgi:hypothetical protein